jgi:hypothetical protein
MTFCEINSRLVPQIQGAFMKVPSQCFPVVFEEITRSDSPSFQSFYEMYEAAFPIADEREPPEAFDAILRFNADLRLQMAHGPYREIVVAIRAWDGGPMIGGHVFGVTTSAEHRQCGMAASVQGIYTFLHPAARGTLSIHSVAEYSQRAASLLFAVPGFEARQPSPILFEVNNPLRMSTDEIEVDTRLSGTNPFRRYMFWYRSGFWPLDFPYVQPRLRDDASAIHYLDLFCTHGAATPLPAKVLFRHLSAFVSVSVLKGRDACSDTDFVAMKKWLESRDTVEFKRHSSEDIAAIANHVRKHSTKV